MHDGHRLLTIIAIGYKVIKSQGEKHVLVTVVINIDEITTYRGRQESEVAIDMICPSR